MDDIFKSDIRQDCEQYAPPEVCLSQDRQKSGDQVSSIDEEGTSRTKARLDGEGCREGYKDRERGFFVYVEQLIEHVRQNVVRRDNGGYVENGDQQGKR